MTLYLSSASGFYALGNSTVCLQCPAGSSCAFSNAPPSLWYRERPFNQQDHLFECFSYNNQLERHVCPRRLHCVHNLCGRLHVSPHGWNQHGKMRLWVRASILSNNTCCKWSHFLFSRMSRTFSLGAATNCSSCMAGFECKSGSDIGTAWYLAFDFISLSGDCPAPAAIMQLVDSRCAQSVPEDTFATRLCTIPQLGFSPSVSVFCQKFSIRSAPVKCSAGYYSAEGQVTCQPCPPGFSCANSTTLPV